MLWRRSYDTPPPPIDRRRRVVPGRRPALRRPARRDPAAHRVPGRRGATGCCRTGTTRSCPTCAPAGPCWSPRTATRCARWSSTSTGSSDEAVVGLNIPTGIPLLLRARRATCAPITAGRGVPRPGGRRRGDRGGREPGPVGRPRWPTTATGSSRSTSRADGRPAGAADVLRRPGAAGRGGAVAGALVVRRRRRRRRAHPGRQRRGVRPVGADAADAGRRGPARPVGRAVRRARLPDAAAAGAGRGDRAVRRTTGTATWPPPAPAAATGVPMVASTLIAGPAGGRGRGARRHPGLVPALPAQRPGADRELRAPRRGRRLRRRSSSRSTRSPSAGGRATSTLASFPQLRGLCLANYFTDPVFRAKLAAPPEEDPQAATGAVGVDLRQPELTWDDLAWLRSLTRCRCCSRASALRRTPAGPSTPGWTASTAPTTAAGRPTAGCRRWTACPASSRRPATSRSASTPASAAAPHVVKALALGATAVGDRPALRVRAGGRRPGRHRARAALPARRDRPDHGRRRLPAHRRPDPGRAAPGRAVRAVRPRARSRWRRWLIAVGSGAGSPVTRKITWRATETAWSA